MAAKHMKLLLAALALLVALAATFVHAHADKVFKQKGVTSMGATETCLVINCAECEEGTPYSCKSCNPPYILSEDKEMCSTMCLVEHCAECEEGKPDTCARCTPPYILSDETKTCDDGCGVANCALCEEGKADTCARCADKYQPTADKKQCKDGVVAPARAAGAALAACVLGAAVVAL